MYDRFGVLEYVGRIDVLEKVDPLVDDVEKDLRQLELASRRRSRSLKGLDRRVLEEATGRLARLDFRRPADFAYTAEALGTRRAFANQTSSKLVVARVPDGGYVSFHVELYVPRSSRRVCDKEVSVGGDARSEARQQLSRCVERASRPYASASESAMLTWPAARSS